MKKKGSGGKFLVITSMILLAAAVTAVILFITSRPGYQAEKAVETFYSCEQKGQYADSWVLLHSRMKEKFGKGHYIQDRAHVFMNHFGVETFTFTTGKVAQIDSWSMEKGTDPFKNVYVVPVVQTFKGKYGLFRLHQEVYVTEEKGEWKILWDYNK
ncbi:hypothetical protein GLW04_13555 [Halobacillus litoralis]|uniref:DUF4878 domain-containing protein n=1 Tax=Halobacillus litoralis TaxID=45668 RepID=A0A845E5K9_9BACI|nr:MULTISPECIES: hypothetical protein [Halobacillus]MYL20924.1 hypothetical protein [Halobacillus litoralis]MYL30964.1 hypothetical protein [Halobacillus halophilus]